MDGGPGVELMGILNERRMRVSVQRERACHGGGIRARDPGRKPERQLTLALGGNLRGREMRSTLLIMTLAKRCVIKPSRRQ